MTKPTLAVETHLIHELNGVENTVENCLKLPLVKEVHVIYGSPKNTLFVVEESQNIC